MLQNNWRKVNFFFKHDDKTTYYTTEHLEQVYFDSAVVHI